MSYSAAERESVLQCDDESKKWIVSSYQQTVQTKLKRAGILPLKVSEDGQHFYELDFNQVSFRSGKKRQMSEEQKQAAGERMRNMHKNKK